MLYTTHPLDSSVALVMGLISRSHARPSLTYGADGPLRPVAMSCVAILLLGISTAWCIPSTVRTLAVLCISLIAIYTTDGTMGIVLTVGMSTMVLYTTAMPSMSGSESLWPSGH